ncbi:DUF3566 domain-containing protein [Corynebacterium tapiri]|uniref:DUF3566 domain-containing protein n=1 Tax=Corynebacterium tapiri TaxID=1448266 RepID=A0A5C4U2W8_9CORY|nr:DUF3566 domain-containing protein [Corynebacterium tapiri]TNL96848.1 DUF3566 domain-containing protein [Corynebacterium tapiri]
MTSRYVALTHVSPISAFKVAAATSLVGFIAWMIAVILLYLGMDLAGIWASVNSVLGGVGGSQKIGFGLVVGLGALMGAILAVLLTVLAPIGALIYNAIVGLVGALEVETADVVEN